MPKRDAELWTSVTAEERELIRHCATLLGTSMAGFLRAATYRQIERLEERLGPEAIRPDGRGAQLRAEIAREELRAEVAGG